MRPKSINSLMAYMRDNKGIKISGSSQKKKLRYIGYYHGYKGYRYCNSPSSLLSYNNFNELYAVYDFDMKLKAMLYPQIMFLETALKNYALEEILIEANSDRFVDIYDKVMNDYKAFHVNDEKYKEAITKRMRVRNNVYSIISREYNRSNIVTHYYQRDRAVPIWGVFELLSLGDFCSFISCLNLNTRSRISRSVEIKTSMDRDGQLLEIIIKTLKDLRNAVAHNNTVFDARFRQGRITSRLSNYVTSETGVSDISFDTILDYVILISFVMKMLGRSKSDILSLIKQFEDACEALRKAVPMNIFSKIVYTNTKRKLSAMKKFL